MKIICFLCTCLLLTGCSETDYDRSRILDNTADNLILPAYNNFDDKASTLQQKTRSFTEEPRAETLANLRLAWKDAIKSWKRAEVYNFGPVESLFLVSSIDRWPTSEGGIETAIEEYDGSEEYLIRIGSNRKGLPAIEYLLFHAPADVIIREFSTPNRKAYLNRLTESLTRHITHIIEIWEKKYKNQFVQETGNTSMSGITLLANEMGYLLEMIRRDKLNIPFGGQTAGTLRLQMLESEHAHYSKELIRANLESVQSTFNGGEGQGFDDYLDALKIEDENGILLSETINDEFKKAYAILDSMDGTLKEAMQYDKTTVEQLITTVQNIHVYIDVDMISRLGILTVYSDNDGD